jgi:hypothetical protein
VLCLKEWFLKGGGSDGGGGGEIGGTRFEKV